MGINETFINSKYYVLFSIEQIWRDYWSKDLLSGQSPKSEEHNKENEVSTSAVDQEASQQIKKAASTTTTTSAVKRQKIPVEELASLLQSPNLQNFVQEADYALYQYIVDILLPKVFSVYFWYFSEVFAYLFENCRC